MGTKEIPRGLESRRQHDDSPLKAEAMDRVGELPLDTSTLGPIKIDPTRPTLLEDEIRAVLVSRPNPNDAVRRILKIDRIRRALRLLDEMEDASRSIVKDWPESSDAR